jgi:DNA invertase Pin-like site-specific DNA recombinase
MAAKAPDAAEPQAEAGAAEEKKPSRAATMRAMFKNGMTRSEVAKEMNVTYKTVFAATRGLEQEGGSSGTTVGRQKIMITHPDTGEEVPRIDYIREAFEKGQSRGEIAKKLNTTYQIVYQATKGAEQADSDDDEDEELEDGEEVEDELDDDAEEEDDEPVAEDLLPPS